MENQAKISKLSTTSVVLYFLLFAFMFLTMLDLAFAPPAPSMPLKALWTTFASLSLVATLAIGQELFRRKAESHLIKLGQAGIVFAAAFGILYKMLSYFTGDTMNELLVLPCVMTSVVISLGAYLFLGISTPKRSELWTGKRRVVAARGYRYELANPKEGPFKALAHNGEYTLSATGALFKYDSQSVLWLPGCPRIVASNDPALKDILPVLPDNIYEDYIFEEIKNIKL